MIYNQTKLYNWRSRLHAVIQHAHGKPFGPWGTFDCGLFQADCVQAQLGVDPAAALRGTYTSAIGAVKALKRAGYDDLKAMMDTHFKSIHHSVAQEGDLSLCISAETGYAAGCFLLERVGVLTPNGFGFIERHTVDFAYRVGP